VRVIDKARRLDPEALGEDATLGEAVKVLKRYGEPVGISDEVLEMRFSVPTPREEEDAEEEGLSSIHILAYPSTATTCTHPAHGPEGISSHLGAPHGRSYAGSRKRASENKPSTHSGE
jgi:hypothetical protein